MAAITHFTGPAMVLAGPGSGKTFVIVQRIRYLIEYEQVPPEKILVITFTKAAAMEMRERFTAKTHGSYPDVVFGTFHSVFFQILKRSAKGSSLKILTEADKIRFLTDVLRGLENCRSANLPQIDRSRESLGLLLSEIARLKNDGLTPESAPQELQQDIEHLPNGPLIGELFARIERAIHEAGYLDFEDMIGFCLRLLQTDAEAAAYWQRRFSFLLIDEFQDIAPMQHNVVECLMGEARNLFVVGDDDQSIYGFRGSKPEIMLGFRDRFPDCSLIQLSTNYRSDRRIVELSDRVIRENLTRFPKDILPRKDCGEGVLLLNAYPDIRTQYQAVPALMRELNLKPEDLAFLFRTGKELTEAASYLMLAGVPCRCRQKLTPPLDRMEVRILLAVLEASAAGCSPSRFVQFMNQPNRDISRDAVAASCVSAGAGYGDEKVVSEKALLRYYQHLPGVAGQIRRLFRGLDAIRTMRPSLAIRYVRRQMGLDAAFRRGRSEEEAEKLLEEVYEPVWNLAQGCRDLETFLNLVSKEQEKARILLRELQEEHGNQKGVQLMTMHASKGLEFPAVWLANLNEGILPSRKSVEGKNLEEERRLFYVAMTRARTHLIMTYAVGSGTNKIMPSRFLSPVVAYLQETSERQERGREPQTSASSSGTISSNSASSR